MDDSQFISTVGFLLTLAAIATVAVVMLLAFATIVGLRRPTQRVDLSPFSFLETGSGFDGEACARLLEMEFDDDDEEPDEPSSLTSRIGGRGKTRTRMASSASQGSPLKLNAKVAGASIPLEFLWAWIRRILDGPVHSYVFVVSRNLEGGFRIDAARDRSRFVGYSSDYEKADDLRTAIVSVAEDIRASYADFRPALLSQFQYQGRFAKARSLIAQSGDQLADRLPETLYFAGENEEALRLFLSENDDGDKKKVVRCLLDLRKYDAVLARLSSVNDSPTNHSLYLMRGEAFRGMREIGPAEAAYSEAISAAEVITNERPDDEDALWTIVDANMALSEISLDNLEDERREQQLNAVISTCEKLERFDFGPDPVRMKSYAMRDLGRIEDALHTFNYCQGICEDHRAADPNNVYLRSEHAWTLTGIASCSFELLRRLVLSKFPDDTDKLKAPFNILDRLAQYIGEVPSNERNRTLSEALDGKQRSDIDIVLPDKILSRLGPIGKDREFTTEVVTEFVRQQEAESAARQIFSGLQVRQSRVHRAEGHYGMAWTMMMNGDDFRDALPHFEKAFSIDVSLRERAYWDCDMQDDLRYEEFNGTILD